jgi:hypothetical protein
MKIPSTLPGKSKAISVYTSRSASPLSPTRMNLRLGKSVMILSRLDFFLSATGSNIPCRYPEYCFRWKEPLGRFASLKKLVSTGYICQGEFDT